MCLLSLCGQNTSHVFVIALWSKYISYQTTDCKILYINLPAKVFGCQSLTCGDSFRPWKKHVQEKEESNQGTGHVKKNSKDQSKPADEMEEPNPEIEDMLPYEPLTKPVEGLSPGTPSSQASTLRLGESPKKRVLPDGAKATPKAAPKPKMVPKAKASPNNKKAAAKKQKASPAKPKKTSGKPKASPAKAKASKERKQVDRNMTLKELEKKLHSVWPSIHSLYNKLQLSVRKLLKPEQGLENR